jgi:hypothetical protein
MPCLRARVFSRRCSSDASSRSMSERTVAMAVWSMVHGLVSLAIRQRLDKLVAAEEVENTMHESLDWLLKTMKKA